MNRTLCSWWRSRRASAPATSLASSSAAMMAFISWIQFTRSRKSDRNRCRKYESSKRRFLSCHCRKTFEFELSIVYYRRCHFFVDIFDTTRFKKKIPLKFNRLPWLYRWGFPSCFRFLDVWLWSDRHGLGEFHTDELPLDPMSWLCLPKLPSLVPLLRVCAKIIEFIMNSILSWGSSKILRDLMIFLFPIVFGIEFDWRRMQKQYL